MTTSLRQGLTFCRLDNRIVFLDLPADRYFCLSQDVETVFANACAGKPIARSERAMLVRAGIVSPSPDPLVFQECRHAPAHRSALERPAHSARLVVLAGLCGRFLLARSNLQRRGLDRTLASLSEAKPQADRAGYADVMAIADAYRRCTRIVGSQDRCLPYAMAVARSLYAAGAAADLVIGIAMPPFRAHAWVQWHDMLVNERLEIAAHYTPIAVL